MMADSSTSTTSATSVLTYWKQFDLQNVQKELDETATDLANRQDESDASRKRLVEQSKDFKKNAPEEVRKLATPLLKSFQGEVDYLSKRSKAAEAAFLDLYKKIIESPDPVQALEGAVQWQKRAQRVQDLEIENANFRETLDQYNVEFAEIKNQEVTIRQLREKVKNFEDHIEQEVQTKVDEKEVGLQRFYQDRERQLQEAGGILSMKMQEAERRAEALQNSLTAAQQELFSLRARADDSRDARATEVEMLAADLERANQRAESAEREAQALREQMTETRSVGVTDGDKDDKELDEVRGQLAATEIELTSKDRQIKQLLEEVKQTNLKLAEASVQFDEDRKRTNSELLDKSRALESLEARIVSQADYEDVKRELSVMKSIEFGNEVSEGDSGGGKSLEVLLLEKNKSLQAEKTALTVARKELEEDLNRAQEEYKSAVSTVQHQKDLIANLEQDLFRVNSLQRSEAEGAADPSESPTELISKALNEKNESSKGAADSLLPIVASQRERFRQRVQEVEEQNLQYQQHMALLQTEIEKMRSDNVKLFEKIKFLQSYSSRGTHQTTLPSDETVEKYSSQYEDSIDPFRRFNIQERQRKYAALRTHDKATLGISRVMMSSSRTRAFFFFYFIFLHCLVFIVLYKLAYTESCKRDFASDCVQRFKEHMEQVHGEHAHHDKE